MPQLEKYIRQGTRRKIAFNHVKNRMVLMINLNYELCPEFRFFQLVYLKSDIIILSTLSQQCETQAFADDTYYSRNFSDFQMACKLIILSIRYFESPNDVELKNW